LDPSVIGVLSGLIVGSITGPTARYYAGSVAVPAVSGTPSTMDFWVMLKEDCSSAGWMSMEIRQGPEHGQLTIRNAKGRPSYPSKNKRVKCNKLTVDGTLIEYTSKQEYRGPDIFSIWTRTSLGYEVTRVYYVTVK
jgi:hypothetical protein